MSIDFTVSIRDYQTYGGHRTLSVIGDHLTMICPDFGPAIDKISIDVCFASKPGTPPKKSLESLFKQFHDGLVRLPQCKFNRAKKRLNIEFLSGAGYASDPHVRGYGDPDLSLYCAVLKEIAVNLRATETKVKSRDEFQLELFREWSENLTMKLPASQEDLLTVKQEAMAHADSRRASMDAWERLSIDWVDFHDDARRILCEPFFWDSADDFAPHGNDTGADLLHEFQEWRKTRTGESGEQFFRTLWQSWWPDNTELTVVKQQKPDDVTLTDHDKMTVALAFAHLKVDGSCPHWIQTEARESLERQRSYVRDEAPKWQHLDEYLEKTARMQTVLSTCPVVHPK